MKKVAQLACVCLIVGSCSSHEIGPNALTKQTKEKFAPKESAINYPIDFGWIGSIHREEKRTSRTKWIGDWDQKTIDRLIDCLPL